MNQLLTEIEKKMTNIQRTLDELMAQFETLTVDPGPSTQDLRPCPICRAPARIVQLSHHESVTCSNNQCAINRVLFTRDDWQTRGGKQ